MATPTATQLNQKKCRPCEGGTPALSEPEIRDYLKQVDGWSYSEGEIAKTFEFKNYYQTVSFVNAVAWIAHQEDHHPEIEFGYKKARVRFSTHAVKGLSENDFISAAKVDALLRA